MNKADKHAQENDEEYLTSSESMDLKSLQEKLESYDREKHILLELSNDLTIVKEKNDLIKLFSSRLKGFFHFRHAVISLIDQKNNTYFPFLLDPETHPSRSYSEFASAATSHYSLNDPFSKRLLDSPGPVTILLDDLIKERGLPAFIPLLYNSGIKKLLVTPIHSKMELFGFVLVSTDSVEEFSDEFKGILEGIAPHLSNAVSNIIFNEDIRYKELVNQILLSLSNDLVTVRDRTDLLNVISFGLKKLIYFSHSTMGILSDSGDTYHAFLIDPNSRAKRFPEYSDAITVPNPVGDGIYDLASRSNKPVVFNMKNVDLRKAPLWFKLNLEAGGKEMLIKTLPGKGTPQHTLILFSDRLNTFDEKAINIVERISSQLATAASNISANEEIISKEKDKSFLLDFSQRLASARTKNELSLAIHSGLKNLTQVRAYFIRTINDDGETMSPFVHDDDVFYVKDPAFRELLATKIPIDVGITGRVMKGNIPVKIDFKEEISHGNTDQYVEFWKRLGPQKEAFQKMIGTPLCVGDRKFGILWIITPQMNVTILEGVCAQISVAISNIKSNEEIVEREEEKSILLSLSREIAAMRYRDDLLKVVNAQFKTLFSIENFGLLQINQDNTYSAFSLDLSEEIARRPEYNEITLGRYSVTDKVFTRMMNSDDPIIFDVNKLSADSDMPKYVAFWKKLGLQKVLGIALRVGGKNIGCTFLHIDSIKTGNIKLNLLKAACAQISVAMSNIMSNEDIEEREKEKATLLSLSDEIAALRSRNDLLHVVNTKLKALFCLRELGIAQINEEGTTYSAFVIDMNDTTKSHANFKEVTSGKYKVSDPVFSSILNTEDPIQLDVNKLAEKADAPAYVAFWKTAGYRHVLGAALRAGGKNIGCVFLHVEPIKPVEIKINLLKAVCAQLAVAVSNILANERISEKNDEQTFLLEFSHDIAQVRTKPELQVAISKVLDKTLHIKLDMIHVIAEDGFNLFPFMYDSTVYEKVKGHFDEVVAKQVTIEEPYTAKVLASKEGLVFNVEEELKTGNEYASLWKTTGLENMYSLPLRLGNKNLGTIWIMANHLSDQILKGVCAQISIAIDNIQANEKLLAYKQQLEIENDQLKEQIKTIYNFSDIVGSGTEMQKVYHMMSLVAESNSTVLLLGETGTGKELIARAIHNSSPRKNKLMIKVNCAALPANLIESELFGHEKGSFTGAIDRRVGKFELANNGSIFLDEIGEMPLETQVKLLRVIQERELERVGGKATIKVDVRIIAATNRNLEEEVNAGRFRSDLYYRLNVFPIILPPLRDRTDDIAPLANFFLARYCKNTGKKITAISSKVIQELKSYLWPGNVRELEHLIERSVLLTQGKLLNEIQLPKTRTNEQVDGLGLSSKTLQQLERIYIIETLKRCSGKVSGKGGAADLLELPSTTLHSKMKKLGISKGDYFHK